MVVPASCRISRVPHYSGSSPLRATTTTGLSPSLVHLPRSFVFAPRRLCESYNPAVHVQRFRLFRFRSPLLAESFLFLGLMRCFSSPGSPPRLSSGCPGMTQDGFPHSDIPGSRGCTRLTGAFRSVPRPSSALDAQASTVCPYSLIHVIRRN